ncbi:MAG: oligosaccharide flippase family protein [Chloroflexi bacterium]|nr:oligosaccharide flippase family protein [Chloroflexota bacterium]
MRASHRASRLATLVCVAFLLVLPLTLFLSVTVGSATLLPADNLFDWEPFRSAAASFGVTRPQNHLLSDLILENYPWKQFIIESIRQGELPLWNPYLFAGIPFLAAGQHSALYPLSILYYVLPLEKAYGWFTVLNLGLAGVFMFLYMRTLGLRRASATFAGIAYQLSGFLIVSVVFPMIVAAAAWLPLILAMCEHIIRQSPGLRGRASSVPWVVIGAFAITMHILAGHVEITVYAALITALYCMWRLGSVWLDERRNKPAEPGKATGLRPPPAVLRPLGWLAIMALLGAGISAIQLVPLFEVVQTSFRAARSSLSEVMDYGFPVRHILLWLMPNFYGNPAHHTFFDLFTWSTQTVTTPSGHTDWGMKNYVEGGAYIGISTLLFAGIATARYLVALLKRYRARTTLSSPLLSTGEKGHTPTGFFIVLGLLSISFMFGTPLYALLYYGLPGINQLHSPFRWVFAFTLCLAGLAGMGTEWVIGHGQGKRDEQRAGDRISIPIARLSFAGIAIGVLVLLGLVAVRVAWPAFEPLVTRALQSLAKANEGFASAQAFFSYEARNVAIFAVLLIASCALLLLARRFAARTWWGVLAIALLAVDLNIAWVGFNPSVDPKLLQVQPEAVRFLQQDKSLWRFTTYDPYGLKPFNANAGWLYHLQDIRGYDSIIPRQYVEYMQLIEPQGELMYNRIAPLSQPASLESPLLDLLNVKYVLTNITTTINTPGFTQVFEGDGLRIYQNERVMPRAFTLPGSSALLTHNFAASVQTNDPRQYVMVDANCGVTDAGCVIPRAAPYTPANVTVYKNNEVWVDAQITQTSWLILADSYYPGWRAFIRPFGGTDKDEHEVQVVPANGNFRAVKLEIAEIQTATSESDKLGEAQLGAQSPISPSTLGRQPSTLGRNLQAPTAAAYTVRFKYSPDSFRIGAFASFISLAALLLIAAVYLWRLFYHEGLASSPVRRIAKNSLVLTGFNLVSRLIDFAFAILMLRVLGPEGVGKYAFAVVIIGWFDILMNFGLNTFLTREVARDKAHANKYLYNTTVLRLLLGLGTAPLVILVILLWGVAFDLAGDTALAIALLAVGQVISSLSTGLSALFFAHEKAEFPAALTIVSSLIKVSLGAVALLTGFGIIGLALTSIITNIATLAILLFVTVRTFFVPHREDDPQMRRGMLRESFPLMLNHLLATLFFKVDVPLLEAMKSATVVGWYSAAYKYVDAFNIIPSFFTQSIFPAMSRMANQSDNAMARSYILSLKLLVMTALPLAILSTFLAPYMIGLLGGAEYLPHGAIALQIMIWSIPFGWINSVTNYALIAVNQQRALTRAFIIGLTFNVIANLILIPLYSYQAAAAVTIFSEIVEGGAFYFYVRRHIVKVNWLDVLGRPALAAALMAGVIFFSTNSGWLVLGVVFGVATYLGALVLTGVLSPIDRAILAPLLPARFRREIKTSQV